MRWEGTDNFGNLMIAESDSTGPTDLRPDLESLVREVFGRHSSGVAFAIDLEYQEVAAPDAGQVSHILRIPWLHEGDSGHYEAISQLLTEILQELHLDASVHGPWP